MREAFVQSLQNLRANKLRSFLTMFGILWGIVSIVVLSAMGEGFQRGNDDILREFGKNIGIVWGGRTSMQAGGERAGRIVRLHVDDARAIARQSHMIESLSPEIQRGGIRVKSRYNSASVMVHGIEPPYQDIRTIELDQGRLFNWNDEEDARRVAIVGADMAEQLFGSRPAVGETVTLNGVAYAVAGRIRRKEQDSNYSGPDNNKVFVPFRTMQRDFPLPGVEPGTLSQIIVAPHGWVVDQLPAVLEARPGRIEDVVWPLEKELRGILAGHKGFDPDDREAVTMWDTSLNTLMFARIIGHLRDFFTIVGFVTLALGGIGVMNIMLVAVRERTREIGVRKALGARTRTIQRQFFLEGFFLTALSGGLGLVIGFALCQIVNLAPMPPRFAGMVVTWQTSSVAVATLVLVGIVTSTYPARKAARLPPVEALRYEM